MTRRELFAAAAAAGTAAIAGPRSAPVGVQMYTVRNIINKDTEGTIRTIAEIGYSAVEAGRTELVQLQPLLKKYKLAAPIASVETPLISGQWKLWRAKEASWDDALESVKAAGAKWATIAYLMPPERTDIPGFIEKMNAAGEKCKKAGIQLCYHNHCFEFGGEKGQRPIDLMLKSFDPNLVKFELDVFWVSVGGQDPTEFIRANAKHIGLIHLKDKAKGTPVQFNEMVKPEAFKEVGSGVLDFPAIIKAASAAGAGYYMVEQDQTPGNPLDSLRKSFEYLKSIKAPGLKV